MLLTAIDVRPRAKVSNKQTLIGCVIVKLLSYLSRRDDLITATIFEAKTNLSALLKQVQTGETVIITSGREKTPVARLEAFQAKPEPQRLGVAYDPNFVLPDSFWDPLPEEELRLWEEGDPDHPLYMGRER